MNKFLALVLHAFLHRQYRPYCIHCYRQDSKPLLMPGRQLSNQLYTWANLGQIAIQYFCERFLNGHLQQKGIVKGLQLYGDEFIQRSGLSKMAVDHFRIWSFFKALFSATHENEFQLIFVQFITSNIGVFFRPRETKWQAHEFFCLQKFLWSIHIKAIVEKIHQIKRKKFAFVLIKTYEIVISIII